jgi:uncharacterized protein YndB with AHSA1/START domain
MRNEKSVPSNKDSSTQSQLLVVTRDFQVSVKDLFNAFTNSDAIKQWWWPNGLHTERVDFNFSEGGIYFIDMVGSPDASGGMTGRFEKIVDQKCIVMSDHFADRQGRAITAKEANMPGDWPETVYITFDFEDRGSQGSRVTLSQQGIPNELQRDCMQGWNEMFDKLERFLLKH